MKTLRQRLLSYIQSTRRAAKGNMEMSVTRKGELCSERHKVILRNISMEQTRTADELERILRPKPRKEQP